MKERAMAWSGVGQVVELPHCGFTSVLDAWKQNLQHQESRTQMTEREQELKMYGEMESL